MMSWGNRTVRRRAVVALAWMEAILRPLLHIAEHVVQAESIGLEFPDRSCERIAVAAGQESPGSTADAKGRPGGLVETIAVGAERRAAP